VPELALGVFLTRFTVGLAALASPDWIALMAYGMENIGRNGFDLLAAGNTVGYLPNTIISHGCSMLDSKLF